MRDNCARRRSVQRSEQRVETAVEIRLEIARSGSHCPLFIDTSNRISEFSEVQANKAKCAVAIEGSQ